MFRVVEETRRDINVIKTINSKCNIVYPFISKKQTNKQTNKLILSNPAAKRYERQHNGSTAKPIIGQIFVTDIKPASRDYC